MRFVDQKYSNSQYSIEYQRQAQIVHAMFVNTPAIPAICVFIPCSSQEAVYRILSLPMKQLSRSVVFVDTNPKNERIAVLKDSSALSQLDDSYTNVYQKSLIDRYQHRPQDLQSILFG